MATLEEARKADGEKLNETLNDLMEKVSQRCKKLEIARDVMAKKPGGHYVQLRSFWLSIFYFETVHFEPFGSSTIWFQDLPRRESTSLIGSKGRENDRSVVVKTVYFRPTKHFEDPPISSWTVHFRLDFRCYHNPIIRFFHVYISDPNDNPAGCWKRTVA